MAGANGVLLTGATGLLGQCLLRELTRAGHRLTALVRDSRAGTAVERAREAMAFASESAGESLPAPTVVSGDLREPGLGLSAVDRAWLARRCRNVVHSAASVSFRPKAASQLQATNVEGTRRLLQVCAAVGFDNIHHVSTAFVCGDRTGVILESDLNLGQDHHNAYERSKHDAEQVIFATENIRATIY